MESKSGEPGLAELYSLIRSRIEHENELLSRTRTDSPSIETPRSKIAFIRNPGQERTPRIINRCFDQTIRHPRTACTNKKSCRYSEMRQTRFRSTNWHDEIPQHCGGYGPVD